MYLPHKVDMGIYLLNYITMLKYNMRGGIRRVQEFLTVNNNLNQIVNGINDALITVGDSCKSEYDTIQTCIRKSRRVHIDETGFHVDGKRFWLWALRSAEDDILVVITDLRARGEVKETMCEDFQWPCDR